MPNTETVRALINAFNLYNYGRNTVETNFKLQSRGGKDYIVVSFDKGMKDYQCSKYLYNIKRKIVGEFYGIEEGDTDEVVLNTANLIFNIESFPFDTSRGKWSQDEQGRIEFLAPIDKGVIFNLKSHLASSLKKDVLEGMSACRIVTKASNKKDYLWHGKFDNKELRKQFEREFLFRMRERYENAPKNPLKVEGNSVYIKDVFDDARFIDSVTRRVAWLEGMYLGVDSSTNHRVKLFKDMIVESIGESTGVIIYGFMCASPLNRKEASILIPIMQDYRGARFLTKEEARNINHAFNNVVLDDVSDKVQAEISVNGSNVVYGIDFSNKEISHCVITKIIESSVINKDHELSIDPELHFQALSPAQSPFNSPTHAGPSGLETPPNSKKRNKDSGKSSSKLEDSVAYSTTMPLTTLSCTELEPPMRSRREEALKESPRQGLPSVLPLNPLDIPETSKGFSPSPQLNSTAVSQRTGKCVSAAKNVQAGTSAWTQQPNRWSSPAPSAGPSLWQTSRPSSWKGANESGSTWTSQPIDSWSSLTPSAEPSLWQTSRPSSSEDANKSVQTGNSTWYVSLSYSSSVEGVNDKEHEEQQVSDEYPEAKSQESESLKEKFGAFVRSLFLSSKRSGEIKRHDVGRDTTRSTPVTPVTKKPPLSERSASERKAKNNPSSGVTSPMHGGAPGGLKPLTSDERNELRPFLSPELQKELDSGSLKDAQIKYLLYTLGGKRETHLSIENETLQLWQLTKAQLSDNSSSKKVDRDSGFGSTGSPAVSHEGSVSSELEHPQQVKHMSEALGK